MWLDFGERDKKFLARYPNARGPDGRRRRADIILSWDDVPTPWTQYTVWLAFDDARSCRHGGGEYFSVDDYLLRDGLPAAEQGPMLSPGQ